MAGRVTRRVGRLPRRAEEEIGDRLSRLRRERGISQVDLGSRIDLDQRMVSCYETNRIRIPAEMLLKIADVLKVSVYELLGRATSNRPAKNPKLWRMIETIEALPPRDQKVVLRTIEALTRDTNGRG